MLSHRYVVYSISTGFLFILAALPSCRKEPVSTVPLLEFLTGPGVVSNDTTLVIGQNILVGVKATGKGSHITYFHIGWNSGVEQTILDSGMNQPVLTYFRTITKAAGETETWTFTAMDRNRNSGSIHITLKRSSSSQYGPVRFYPDILLGAQGNPDAGSFFSLNANRRYFLDEAFLHQDSIDLIYYYDLYEATLSSPAEADVPDIFTGPAGISNWTVRNETRYDTTVVSPAEFDQSGNDSLILAAYNPVDLKRKAKYLQPGMVILFRDPSGRLGLILVKEIVTGTQGYVRIGVKIQQNLCCERD